MTSINKKRKLSPPVEAVDSRFSAFENLSQDEAEPELEIEDGTSLAGPSTGLPAHLLPSTKKASSTPGLIYISRIPPGMGPAQMKHLLSAYGEIGRVFLARSEKDKAMETQKKSKKGDKEKHREHRFVEGWIEFTNKKVARSVAEMLNANTIGGKKGTRFRDDVWTMQYLPRFRWDMLSEQVALERATQTSLLRFHLQNTRTEQESYLQSVEKARVSNAIESKAETRREGKKLKLGEESVAVVEKKASGRERSYRQREVVDVAGKSKKSNGNGKQDLDSVLDSLF